MHRVSDPTRALSGGSENIQKALEEVAKTEYENYDDFSKKFGKITFRDRDPIWESRACARIGVGATTTGTSNNIVYTLNYVNKVTSGEDYAQDEICPAYV